MVFLILMVAYISGAMLVAYIVERWNFPEDFDPTMTGFFWPVSIPTIIVAMFLNLAIYLARRHRK